MTAPVTTCRRTTALRTAARLMLEENIGCLPIVDAHRHLVGILTDRDVCLAVARQFDPDSTLVHEVMTTDVFSCREDDQLETALVAMKEHRLRRIPVVDTRGAVKGLLSIDDAIRNTGRADGRLPAEAVVDVLRHICASESDLLLAR
jgi:CBS domain-containing protein